LNSTPSAIGLYCCPTLLPPPPRVTAAACCCSCVYRCRNAIIDADDGDVSEDARADACDEPDPDDDDDGAADDADATLWWPALWRLDECSKCAASD
jgi:hypothetical protein